MRSLFGSIVLLSTMLAIGCTWVDADQCWPNTSGGLGGSGPIPIGAGVGATSGDFLSPPPEHPLSPPPGETPNPCVEQPSTCGQKCEDAQNAAGLECGKIQDAEKRAACQHAAYEVYKSCQASCKQSNINDCKERCKKNCDAIHDRCHADCTKNNPTSKCHAKCNDEYGACLKQCDQDCKGY